MNSNRVPFGREGRRFESCHPDKRDFRKRVSFFCSNLKRICIFEFQNLFFIMKNFFYIPLLSIALISCTSKPNKEDIAKLNGYWEIEKVEFPDGNKKEYKINEFVDFIELKDNKGTRQKVAPELDGTFLKGALHDDIKVVDSADCYYIKTKSKFTKWEEKIVSVSDAEFVLENEAKIVYHFKKFVPYDKRK